jgi:hypothetical protein
MSGQEMDTYQNFKDVQTDLNITRNSNMRYFILSDQKLVELDIFSKQRFFQQMVERVFKSKNDFDENWSVNILLDKDNDCLTIYINKDG